MYWNEQTQTTDSGFMTDGTGEYDIAESTESSITDVSGEYVSAESTEEAITDVKETKKLQQNPQKNRLKWMCWIRNISHLICLMAHSGM